MVTPRKKRPQRLSKWIEANVRLSRGIEAAPGPIRLYPYQKGIAAAIGDPKIERVTVLKNARVGFTAVMTASIAHFIMREPGGLRDGEHIQCHPTYPQLTREPFGLFMPPSS